MQVKGLLRYLGYISYSVLVVSLYPISSLLVHTKRNAFYKNSCLHISYMVHIPWYTVKLLRKHGINARYLAIGCSPVWDKCDYQFVPSRWRCIRAVQEFLFFWRVVAKYEVIHFHFMITLCDTGWELPLLRRLGRKLVFQYRGCEIRDREKNVRLHPEMNICEDCDYGATACKGEINLKRRRLANKYGDLSLITTPDLSDFAPDAIYLPFFAPEIEPAVSWKQKRGAHRLKIVHATNHPGIEGTEYIQKAIDNLVNQGYEIDFVSLTNSSHDRVLEEFATADLTIGKMKMGYYANAQIESMVMGVPTITHVRPEFMTEELRESGFIFSTLNELEETIRYYLDHPEELLMKRRIARSTILRIHNNERLVDQLVRMYQSLRCRENLVMFPV